MATYKVIQDIEAEDKLLGPFSLRQFIYMIIVLVACFIAYQLFTVAWFLSLPLLPLIGFFLLLALPFGHDQSSEVWLLAKFRFFFKPHKRVWDQSGMKHLVTITAPKVVEKHLYKDMSQVEVRSRLSALANTIDSRGWAVRHVDTSSMFGQQPKLAMAGGGGGSDRLVSAIAAPASQNDGTTVEDDILDEQNNPVAQNLGRMVDSSTKARRAQLMEQMRTGNVPVSAPLPSAQAPSQFTQASQMIVGTPENDLNYWLGGGQGQAPTTPGYAAQPNNVVAPTQPPVPQPPSSAAPVPELDEQALLAKIHAEQDKPKNYGHMRVINPLDGSTLPGPDETPPAPGTNPPPETPEQPMVPPPDPAIIDLANNDDLNIATIARQANKSKAKKQPKDEVIISLH